MKAIMEGRGQAFLIAFNENGVRVRDDRNKISFEAYASAGDSMCGL
jgi:hypothetical protein